MIAILAPYGRNEVTSAAIRLADMIAGFGQSVRWVACGLRERHVHPTWDELVVSCRGGYSIAEAAAKASAVIHFQCHQAWYEQAKLVDRKDRKSKQILVPNWHGLSSKAAALIPQFDQIVCPTKLCKRVLNTTVFGGEKIDKDKLTWCRWDAGIPPVRREGTVIGGRLKACLYCDAAAIDFCGRTVIGLIDELLAAFPKLDLSVLSVKSWSKHDRVDLRQAAQKWDKRLRIEKVHSLVQLHKEFHSHDWVMLPSIRADFGMAASLALACGTPVICHEVEPFSELVWQDNGVLVPCEVHASSSKAPLAVPDLGRWLTACESAFTTPKLLLHLQTTNWKLLESQATFNHAWRNILDV